MVSIAVPSSVVNGSAAYSLEQATYALYQIARACVHFRVTEIIIYESSETIAEETTSTPAEPQPKKIRLDEAPVNDTKNSNEPKSANDTGLIFTANMLQYLITPPYLRKLIFKPIGNLQLYRYAERLPKIPGLKDNKKVMQGIAMPREKKKRLPGQKKLTKRDRKDATVTPYINLGFDRFFKLKNNATVQTHSQVHIDLAKGEVVKAPTEGSGFSVRAVSQFSHIFTQSSVPEGYSQTIYIPSQQFKSRKPARPLIQEVDLAGLGKDSEKLLLLFGTWSEVQESVSKDSELDVPDASALFDGASTGLERIRLEDAVMVALARL